MMRKGKRLNVIPFDEGMYSQPLNKHNGSIGLVIGEIGYPINDKHHLQLDH